MKFFELVEDTRLVSAPKEALFGLMFKVGAKTFMYFKEVEIKNRKNSKEYTDSTLYYDEIKPLYKGYKGLTMDNKIYTNGVIVHTPKSLITLFFKYRKWGSGFEYRLDLENGLIYTNKKGLVIGKGGATIKLLEYVLGRKITLKEMK